MEFSQTPTWDFGPYMNEIADLYRRLPHAHNDPVAIQAWRELAADSVKRAAGLDQQYDIREVGFEPYENAEQQDYSVRNFNRFDVSNQFLDNHPLWSVEEGVAFRKVHDLLGHLPSGGNFSWEGELKACGAHFPLLSLNARRALFTECIGQTAFANRYHTFPDQKVALFPNFDPELGYFPLATPLGDDAVRNRFVRQPGMIYTNIKEGKHINLAVKTEPLNSQNDSKSYITAFYDPVDAGFSAVEDVRGQALIKSYRDEPTFVGEITWLTEEGVRGTRISHLSVNPIYRDTDAYQQIMSWLQKNLEPPFSAMFANQKLKGVLQRRYPEQEWTDEYYPDWTERQRITKRANYPYVYDGGETFLLMGPHDDGSWAIAEWDGEQYRYIVEIPEHLVGDVEARLDARDPIMEIVQFVNESKADSEDDAMVNLEGSPTFQDHDFLMDHGMRWASFNEVWRGKRTARVSGDPNEDWNPQSELGEYWDQLGRRVYDPDAHAQTPDDDFTHDPLDMAGAQAVVNAQEVPWWTMDRKTRERAVANALRVGILSPLKLLKFNAVHYQDIAHIPGDETNLDVYLDALRRAREKWNRRGQIGFFDDPEEIDPFDPENAERYAGYMNTHLRYIAQVADKIDVLTDAAEADMQQGGQGYLWRDTLRKINIPGVNNKVASFAWLLLAPNTSELGTIDTHMASALGMPAREGFSPDTYLQLERELRTLKDRMGYDQVPLGTFQWALWDNLRTPPGPEGPRHQSHGAMRVLDPIPFDQIEWHKPRNTIWEGRYQPDWLRENLPLTQKLRQQYEEKKQRPVRQRIPNTQWYEDQPRLFSKKAALSEYIVEYGVYRVDFKDPETGRVIGYILWTPESYEGEGTYIDYLGYARYDEYGPLPSIEYNGQDRVDNNNEIRAKFPNLGRDMLSWVLNNLPPPYDASVANAGLKALLKKVRQKRPELIHPEMALV